MFEYIINFLENSGTSLYWFSAVLGTTLFVLRIIMSFFTGDLDVEELDTDNLEIGHSHKMGPAFKLFTMHSISGFLMMFGFAGLAATEQFGLSTLPALAIALLTGFVVMMLIALLFRGALFFESTGEQFDIRRAVGLTGTVYQRIPASGLGKVQIVVNGITREILAQSENQQQIESFKLVKVVEAIDYETVLVRKL